MSFLIHVVDDEPIIHDILRRIFKDEEYTLEFSTNYEEAVEKHKRRRFDLVLLDLMIPGTSGLKILRELRKSDEDVKVIIMTAYATLESAVEAVELGSIDYIHKPFDNKELLEMVRSALRSDNKRGLEEIKDSLQQGQAFHNIVGASGAMRSVVEKIKKVAKTNSTVLIEGESGTGKELAARAVHMESLRSSAPFVVAYSAPDELLESNLFGHKKGSFTGATADKTGLFDVAHGGTIFFDDVATVPMSVQAKLLRVIQEREFIVVGETTVRKADVRVIAATNQNLKEMVSAGTFREDLYYRLNVVKILLPPLRERKEDIPLLVERFIEKYNSINNKSLKGITDGALKILENLSWPGNVRELENVVESGLIMSDGERIRPEDLPVELVYGEPTALPSLLKVDGTPFKDKVDLFQKSLISEALRQADGVQKRAAELLMMKATTLNEMMKRLGFMGDGKD